MEALHRAGIGALFLTEASAAWRAMQRDGMLFHDRSLPVGVAAAMLYALCERQPYVRGMQREVALANRCQNGLRGEMDRLHEEMQLAASIQREYMNQALPLIPELELGVLFRPMSFVSGDIYSVQRLSERYACFFVADAVGHGVPAALLTMVLTNSLTTIEPRCNGPVVPLAPMEVLARLNRKMCDDRPSPSRFATAVYGVIDLEKQEVTVAGAGHPSPVLLSPEGFEELSTEGPLLGVFGEAEFTQRSATISHRDRLLVYTDGLDVAFSDEKERIASGRSMRHADRLAELYNRVRDGELTHLMEEMAVLLDRQAGSLHREDDITVLAIGGRRKSAAQSLPRVAAA